MQRRADARENHARILAAAAAVFADHGLSAEMKAIAERAGVGVGTLYHHFPSKDELLLAIIAEAREEGLALTEVAEAAPTALAALQTLLAQGFELMDRYGWVLEALLTGELPAAIAAHLQEGSDKVDPDGLFAPLVQRCVNEGSLRADLNVPLAAALLQGAVMPWAYRRFRAGRTPAQNAALVLDLVLRGAGLSAGEELVNVAPSPALGEVLVGEPAP